MTNEADKTIEVIEEIVKLRTGLLAVHMAAEIRKAFILDAEKYMKNLPEPVNEAVANLIETVGLSIGHAILKASDLAGEGKRPDVLFGLDPDDESTKTTKELLDALDERLARGH